MVFDAIFLAMAFTCCTVGSWIAWRMAGISPWRFILALVGVEAAATIGGHLHYVLINPQIYAGRWSSALSLNGSGFHAGGAILFVALAVFPLARVLGVTAARAGDALAPTVAMGLAFNRVNCWLRGCCFGDLCHTGWCVTWPKDSYTYRWQLAHHVITRSATQSLPVYPLQLYFLAAAIGVFAAVLWMDRRRRFDGEPALMALFLFGLSSFALEFLRAPWTDRVYWGPLPQLTWTALALTAVAAVALAAGRRHSGSSRAVPAPAL